MPREHTGHSKHPLPTHKRWFYTWIAPDGQYQNQIDYILCSQRWRSSIQSAKTRLRADYGLDHELIAKFRLKLKKVGKTTRPFRYDLNKIPNNYAVEVTNRFCLRKEEKLKAKEKRKYISIWMQSSKEEQEEIRKPSSMNNAKK